MIKVSIKIRLMVSYAILVFSGLVMTGVAICNTITNVEVADFATVTLTERYGRIHRTVDAIFYLHGTLNAIVDGQTTYSEHRDELLAEIQELDVAQKALQMARYPNEIGQIKEAATHYIDYFNTTIFPSLEANNMYAAKNQVNHELVPLYLTITHNLDTVIGYQITRVHEATEANRSLLPLAITGFFGAITVGVSLFFSIFMPKFLMNTINKLKGSASSIAEGDLGTEIKNTTHDELGEIMDAMEHMRTLWRDRIIAIIKAARSAIQDATKIDNVTKGIATSSNNVQGRSLTVAAASDELVSTTQDIAKNCEDAEKVANDSVEITNRGVSQVADTIDTMLKQVDKTKTDVEHIGALAEQTQKIGSIVATIDEIAAQTNLLALNAAIEAARAGEAGRGFAVVADEVRALASRTSASTQEISSMVRQVQEDANVANDSMLSSLDSMSALASKAEGVQQILRDIINKVNDVNSRLHQITMATDQQAQATSEISENMRTISDAANAFVSDVGEVQGAVQQSMENLGDLLEQVKESEKSL